MRTIEQIPISNIKMDTWRIHPSTLSLIKYLESGGKVPPIDVYKNSHGQFVIKDGRHRTTAYKMMGKNKIKARFSTKVNHLE